MHMIYNIITLIIIESSLLLLNHMWYWPCGRLELALMLGIVVLLSLILKHFLFFHLLRIYSTVVFAPDNKFLMGLLVKQIVLGILLCILLLLRLVLGCKSYDSRTGCLLLLLLEQAYIDTLPFKELHLKRSQIEVIKRLIIILLRCVLLRNILMNVRRDGVWGVFADFTTVFLKYLLLLGICIDGYRIRRDLGRFHQSILGVMQVRSRLYVSDRISLLIRLNLIIGSRYCWIRIMLANWIVFTLEGRMSQFLLLMMLQFAQMIRICKGALMRINFLNGLMVDLLMRVHLILLGGNNVILVVLLGLTSSDKSSLGRRLIWDDDSSLSHICRVSRRWTIHDVHPIGCQMVIFLHHIGYDWPLHNAVMNIQNLLFDRLLSHRNVFVLVEWLSVVGNLQSYVLSAIRIGPSYSYRRMVLRLEFKHLWRLPFLALVLVQSIYVLVVMVVAARENFVLRFSLVISTSGRVNKTIVHITISASKRLWNRSISCMLFLWYKFLFMLSGVWSQLRADDSFLVVCTLIVVLFKWHMSTVESHGWILLFLILDVVLIDVLSTTRIDEYQIWLLL